MPLNQGWWESCAPEYRLVMLSIAGTLNMRADSKAHYMDAFRCSGMSALEFAIVLTSLKDRGQIERDGLWLKLARSAGERFHQMPGTRGNVRSSFSVRY